MVSVIIPTYNREKTIMRAIDSVLNQTYTDFEIIVVDDKSTDNTLTLLDGVEDRRFRYVSLEKNSGACAARNRGIEEAKGEYITFLDSDDAYRADYLSEQLKDSEEQNADVVYCAMMRYYKDTISKIPNNYSSGNVSYRDFLNGRPVSTQLIFGKRYVFDDISFALDMPTMREDWELMIRISRKYKVYYSDKALVDVYLSDSGLTFNANGIDAIKYIYKKNKVEIDEDFNTFYFINNLLACDMAKMKINPQRHYAEILKRKFCIKIFVKYIFAKINIYL